MSSKCRTRGGSAKNERSFRHSPLSVEAFNAFEFTLGNLPSETVFLAHSIKRTQLSGSLCYGVPCLPMATLLSPLMV